MAVTVHVHHVCGHSSTVVSPGPLDPEGLIRTDGPKGLAKLGLAGRECADCAAGKRTPVPRKDGGRKKPGGKVPGDPGTGSVDALQTSAKPPEEEMAAEEESGSLDGGIGIGGGE